MAFLFSFACSEDPESVRPRCHDCGKSFSRKCKLQLHFESFHSGKVEKRERNFVCLQCGKKFFTGCSLEAHERTHLSYEKKNRFQCDKCERRYRSLEVLRQHMDAHAGVKPFMCDTCGKSFARKTNLEQHVVIHSDVKPFSCDQCDKSFSWKSHLTTHLKTHLGLRPHKCEHCDMAFSERSTLRLHMRSIHEAELPYKDNKVVKYSDVGN